MKSVEGGAKPHSWKIKTNKSISYKIPQPAPKKQSVQAKFLYLCLWRVRLDKKPIQRR
ncbi:hypothetical protein AvCA_27410 [Azotobacter vinelandii CA]|uniref:Uncharacterized protein n=2 Tax=Azotobacter vinelandii TaxID=354 RepID=C1DKR3_AZOVD|nr:hypothetical protein Avin_27410 [Azotobacter vinelandii DJ]AGK14862.1 hypothetical protein AvCA_27410 [Azotobacter vinelandii CA]AGK20844.1 hypothetical protein AvCA6_27410 [Azotobacter vinelandii CA6]